MNFVLIAFVINQESQLLYSAICTVTTVTLHENITYLLTVKMPTVSGSNCAERWSQTSCKLEGLANHRNICAGEKAKGFWQTALWWLFLFVVWVLKRRRGLRSAPQVVNVEVVLWGHRGLKSYVSEVLTIWQAESRHQSGRVSYGGETLGR